MHKRLNLTVFIEWPWWNEKSQCLTKRPHGPGLGEKKRWRDKCARRALLYDGRAERGGVYDLINLVRKFCFGPLVTANRENEQEHDIALLMRSLQKRHTVHGHRESQERPAVGRH